MFSSWTSGFSFSRSGEQSASTLDHRQVKFEAGLQLKVVDAAKAVFAVSDYRGATLDFAGMELRSIIGQMSLADVMSKRANITGQLQEAP